MKIIEIPENTWECCRCGCVYQFDEEDIEKGGWPSYTGPYVECPVCGQKHWLENSVK